MTAEMMERSFSWNWGGSVGDRLEEAGNEVREEEEGVGSWADDIMQEFKDRISWDWFQTFLIILVTNISPSYFDVFSDVYLGVYFIKNQDYVWGCLTLSVIFLPGFAWNEQKYYITNNKKSWSCLFTLSCIFFPFFLVLFKVTIYIFFLTTLP